MGNYFVYGKNVVSNLIKTKPNLIREIWIQEDRANELNVPNEIKVIKKSLKQIDEVAEGNHQGFLAFVKEYNYVPFAEIKNDNNILMLDRIQDPHNFGAIIRSAALFGFNSIVILDRNQTAVTPVVVKTSAGTIFNVKIAKVANLSNALMILKNEGHWVYSTYLSDDSVDIEDVDFSEKKVIVIGNEGEGITKKIADNSDYKIKIKTADAIDSLNASVATGVVLYAATRINK
jgi:23S rRNA (guanosine2251-2'-O)-methyltransferase